MYLGSCGDLVTGGIMLFGEVSCADTSDVRLPTFNASHLLNELPPIGTRVATFSSTMFQLALKYKR